MPVFGQIVVGPPGSGKSTFCAGMQQFYKAIGRTCAVINLDPANEHMPYDPAVDIKELVDARSAAEELRLGPNGSLIYCMEELQTNIQWLIKKTKSLKGQYLIFDFPGQVELFTHTTIVRAIVQKLVTQDYRLTAVNLVDSHYCSDYGKYISALMLSLTTMLQLELPHVNVFSKIDLIEGDGPLGFPLENFMEVIDLHQLVDSLESQQRLRKFAKLNRALVEVLEGYSFLNFLPVNIEDKETVLRVSKAIDKANGYVFGDVDLHKFLYAQTSNFQQDPDWNVTIRERYVSDFQEENKAQDS